MAILYVSVKKHDQTPISEQEWMRFIQMPCVYGGGRRPLVNVGVDRIDSHRDYPGNSQPCCPRHNAMKRTFDDDLFRVYLERHPELATCSNGKHTHPVNRLPPSLDTGERRLLEALANGPLPVRELALKLGMKRSSVDFNFRFLRMRGLAEREGPGLPINLTEAGLVILRDRGLEVVAPSPPRLAPAVCSPQMSLQFQRGSA